jgi:hypothetical protein
MRNKNYRLPKIPDEKIENSELLQNIKKRRGGKLLNLDRALLNSNAFANGWNNFLGTVRNKLSLDPKLRELAICAIAILNKADYELAQHAPEFLESGGTKEQLDGLKNIDNAISNIKLFNDKERATINLTKEMTLKVQVSDNCFENIKKVLPNVQQQVELIGVIACYNMVSRFLEAIQIPIDKN